MEALERKKPGRKPLHPLDKIRAFTFNSTERIVENHGGLEKIRGFIAEILKPPMP